MESLLGYEADTLNKLEERANVNNYDLQWLMYFINDFAKDTLDACKPYYKDDCRLRIKQMEELISNIEYSRFILPIKYPESENRPFKKYGKKTEKEFNLYRANSIRQLTKQCGGDVLKANYLITADYKSFCKPEYDQDK